MERNRYRDQNAVYFEAVILASMFALVYIFSYIPVSLYIVLCNFKYNIYMELMGYQL